MSQETYEELAVLRKAQRDAEYVTNKLIGGKPVQHPVIRVGIKVRGEFDLKADANLNVKPTDYRRKRVDPVTFRRQVDRLAKVVE